MLSTAIKHPAPDRVMSSFVILFTSGHSDDQCPDIKNHKWRLNPVWHRTLYTCSCTRMATVQWASKVKRFVCNTSSFFLEADVLYPVCEKRFCCCLFYRNTVGFVLSGCSCQVVSEMERETHRVETGRQYSGNSLNICLRCCFAIR